MTDEATSIDPAVIERLLGRAMLGDAPLTRVILAPFTGEPLYSLPLSGAPEVQRAVELARTAQVDWAARSVRERCRIVLAFHDLVLKRRDTALDIVQLETGKARRDALEELLDVLVTARHYARDARRLLRTTRHRGVFPLMVGVQELHHPRGLVGVLAPWNYPLTLAVSDAIPALLAGNAVILKPDVQTTLTALWAVDLLIEAGVPADLIPVVTGEGPVVGPLVIEEVDYVMFTGSTRVGREVARRCGERLIGHSMELGGKNAMIVRADADIERASEIAVRASFSNSGQLCISMERIYVHEGVYEEFAAAFVRRIEGMKMRPGVAWGADMGSLISATQVERVLGHLADATTRGARVLVGGHHRRDIGPYYVEPTVLENVTTDMALCHEETFGPVVALYKVASDEEAIEAANASSYGLNASVVTRDHRQGRRIAAQLRAGTVNVNEGYAAAWGSTRAPMGGMGDSGMGRRHGAEGLLKYTESQTIAHQRFLGFGAPFGWSDKRWGETLVRAVGALKRLGLK